MEGNLLRHGNDVLLAVMTDGSYISAAETLAKNPSLLISFDHQRSDGTKRYDSKAECKPWRINAKTDAILLRSIILLNKLRPEKYEMWELGSEA